MKIFRASALAIVAAALFSAMSARADYSYDFNNGNDAGLTHYDPLAPFGSGATYTFPTLGAGNNGYRLTSNPSASVGSLGPARVGSYQGNQTFGDFRLSVDIVGWNPQLTQGIGLAARLSDIGLGTSSGYFLHYNPLPTSDLQYLVIERIDHEVADPNNSSVLLAPFDPATGFRMVFTGIGSTLTGQVFALNNPGQLVASVTMVDSTYQSGYTGVLATGLLTPSPEPNTGLDVTYDNLRASAVPEPSSLVLVASGFAGLLLFSRRRATRSDGRPVANRPWRE